MKNLAEEKISTDVASISYEVEIEITYKIHFSVTFPVKDP